MLLVEWDLYVGSSSVVFLRLQHHTMLHMRAAISRIRRMTPRQMAAMAASFKYTSLTSMVRLLWFPAASKAMSDTFGSQQEAM